MTLFNNKKSHGAKKNAEDFSFKNGRFFRIDIKFQTENILRSNFVKFLFDEIRYCENVLDRVFL